MARKKATVNANPELAKPPIQNKSNFPINKIRKSMENQICNLLQENISDIAKAYEQAIALHDTEKKFKYKIAVSFSITGKDANNYEIETSMAFNVKQTAECMDEIHCEADLVDQMNDDIDTETDLLEPEE